MSLSVPNIGKLIQVVAITAVASAGMAQTQTTTLTAIVGPVIDSLGSGGGEAHELSPASAITAPLGTSLAPLTEALDAALDPITDPIDDQLVAPVLDTAAPLSEPLLDAIEPVTDPVDGITRELTGGSLEDALTNIDDNTADGDGLVNDLLGGNNTPGAGTEAGEASPVPVVSQPAGQSLTPLVDMADTALNPLTDAIDAELGEPLLDAISPVTTPLLAAVEPVTDPVDGLLAEITGGSIEDALTNIDDNTADGNGIVNDTLGGLGGDNGDGGDSDNDSNHSGLLALLDHEGLRDGQCPDTDGDGVCDRHDRCPNTPEGKAVLNNGCHLDDISPLRLDGVLFEFDKATLTPESIHTLDAAVVVLQQSYAKLIEIAGHTDSMGTDDYNMNLSQRRAEAVRGYFITRGIAEERLRARGYGESQPVDTNDTDAGRAMNRRVELHIVE